jgi:hypothetical protein
MSVSTQPGHPSWADVNRDVARTVGMPGNTYFAWMENIDLVRLANSLARVLKSLGSTTRFLCAMFCF